MSDPNKALAQQQPAPPNRALAMKQTLAEQVEMHAVLKEYVEKHLIRDQDFGVIPGTKNHTLLQPGAERMAGLFRCIPEYEERVSVADYDRGLFTYEYTAKLVSIDTGEAIAHGIGAASSYESKWRYRNSARKCPQCGKEAIIKGKAEYGGGWLCFDKKGGCKAKFSDGDMSIEEQIVGQVQNENMADLINTVKKISKKRALVDASAGLARRYGINFDVDMEDVTANEAAKAKAHGREPDKHNGTNGDGSRTKDQPVMASKELQDRIVTGLAVFSKKFEEAANNKWFVDNVLHRPVARVEDLYEQEALECLKRIQKWLDTKTQKEAMEAERIRNLINEQTIADINAALPLVSTTWEQMVNKQAVAAIIERPTPVGFQLKELSQAEGVKVKTSLEVLIRNFSAENKA